VNQSIIETSLAGVEMPLKVKPGETIFREGEKPCGIYIVQSGTVDLLFSARNGNVKPLRIAQAGQILGLSCVVTQRDHDCTATARTPCEIGFIGRDEFLRVLDDCPAVWFSVLRLLSNDVNAVYDDMRALAAR
jgi:CRP/FNR family transcriptional regulator